MRRLNQDQLVIDALTRWIASAQRILLTTDFMVVEGAGETFEADVRAMHQARADAIKHGYLWPSDDGH